MSKTDIPPKFKAGEIVVIAVPHWHKHAEYKGKQGTIIGKGDKGWLVYLSIPKVTLELSESDLVSVGEEMERLGKKEKEQEQRWSPLGSGDIVYRKGPGHHAGHVGVIENGFMLDMNTNQVTQWSVKFDNGRGGFDHVYVPVSHLRLATEKEAMDWQPKRDVPRKRYEDPDPAAQTARQKEARQVSDIEQKMREILALTEDDPI